VKKTEKPFFLYHYPLRVSAMCQLAAYVGDRPIAPLLLRAIELQEPYVGGHATGLGVLDGESLKIEKDSGHVSRVRKTTTIETLQGTTGIAHSRYNDRARDDPMYNTRSMAHPFVNDEGDLALMHNGTIYNYKTHWERLREAHVFKSYSGEIGAITDSEIAVHMVSDSLKKGKGMEEALGSTAAELDGSFLLACIASEHPETLWIANWHQPCVVGVGDDEAMFCSSHIGFHEIRDELDRIFEPPKNSLLKLTRGKVEVTSLNTGKKIPRLMLNRNRLAGVILDILNEKGEFDFMQIREALNPDGWAQGYGISNERWREVYRLGVRIVNPFIEVMDILLADGVIQEKVALKDEGGVPDTPRYSYSLI
jgi:glucosamine 6-phosphate synthetase-like amidotransferase/phosphosugar isomerase protein